MSERMGTVESDERFDGTLNNGLVEDGDDECFGNLEFPTDFDGNLELPTDFELLNFELMEKDGVIGDWNVCEWKIPEPSSLDDFMPMDENPDAKQLLNDVEENSGSHIYKIADNFQESSYVFHPTSPVSEIESSGSCSAAKFLPIKSNITKPRSKRSRPTSSVNKWNLIVPFPAPAPRKTSNPRKNKKINKKTSHSSVSVMKDMQNGPVSTKKCTHCEITKTPQWREGPNGLKTLCNACGVRYRSGRLFPEYRPAASPTFVPQLHSNSHKKVVEMRNKAKCSSTKMEEPFLCPEVEFHPVSSYLLEF